ncbi:hypothetical protein AAFC00_003462 [Neodothiora populina]|uniref:Cytochrome P450 alkane hydroxylase n=2 Tax=Neodothiora populina TaxID=2781224 RepID=A0ABR3PE87_9PEZI
MKLADALLTNQSLLLAILATVMVFTITHYIRLRRQQCAIEARLVSQYGCEPPSVLKSKWPLGIDLIVQAFQAANAGHILKFFGSMIETHGATFEQNLLGARGIDTVDPENIEAILSTQFKDFGLGSRRPTFFPLLGDGIFTQDGLAWKHSRDMLRPQFMSNRAKTVDQLHQHLDNLMTAIPNDSPVDLQQIFFRYTLDTTTSFLFGRSLDTLASEDADDQVSPFAEAFTVAQDFLAQRGRLGDFYWLIGGRKFRNACKTVHSFVDCVIAAATEARNERASGKAVKQLNYVFLDALLEETQDPVALRSTCLNILLAGRDTTACCLSWTFHLLARNPAVYRRLRSEITQVIGDKAATQEALKRMPYLHYMLKEVLRLYPSVPVNSRSALRTTTLPRGGGPNGTSPILIRKGEAVGYCAYAMHRRKDLYGADADSFRPERWDVTETENLGRKAGWGYIPFNGGPRTCLGQDFALLEASLAIVRIVQKFETIWPVDSDGNSQTTQDSSENCCGDEPQTLTLVLSNARGCWVRLVAA